MKAKPLQFDALVNQIKTQYKGIVVFGTDFARIQEITTKIQHLILQKIDAFSLVQIISHQLKNSPFLATEEANTPNLMGDRRLIWIKDGQNVSENIIQHFCQNCKTDAFLLISCENLQKNNILRIEAENNPEILTFACYTPDATELFSYVKDYLAQVHFQITNEGIEYLIQNTSGNLLILKSELEKITLFNQNKKTLSLNQIEQLTGSGDTSIETLIQAVVNKQTTLVLQLGKKLLQQGEIPVTLIRSLSKYFDLLLLGKTQLEKGINITVIVEQLLKPAQFRLKQPLQKQLYSWSLKQLIAAHHLLLNTEIQLKTNSLSTTLVFNKCLTDLTLL